MKKEVEETKKTCVIISKENKMALNHWHQQTGLSQNALINLILDDARANPRILQIKLTNEE